MVLFVTLYKDVPTFQFVDGTFSKMCRTIQMKATDLYFPVMLLIMLYKVILTFEPVDD